MNTPQQNPHLQLSVPGMNPDGSIPLELLEQDLQIDIQDNEELFAGDTLVLYVNSVPLGTPHTVTAADKAAAGNDPSFRYHLSISKSLFPSEGSSVNLLLDYAVNSRPVGLPVKISLDREAPGGEVLPYLSFTAEQLDGISQSDLTQDKLLVRAPQWFGKTVGDVITPWLGTSEQGGTFLTESALTVQDVDTALFVNFPKARLAQNGDVTQYFAYKLQDALGNVSAVSRKRAIDVSLNKSSKRSLKSGFSLASLGGPGLFVLQGPQLPPTTFPDGVLPINLLTAPLAIGVPNELGDFFEDSEIQLFRLEGSTKIPVGPRRIVTQAEADDPDFVYELNIPIAEFPAQGATTPWILNYTVFDPLAGTAADSAFPKQVIFDRQAPGGTNPVDLPQLEFTPEQLSGITLADVVGTSIPVQLPAWFLSADDDVVELWLGTSDQLGDGSYLSNTFTLPQAGRGITVLFEVADLTALGNRPQFFGYRLRDKAGNLSPRSTTVAIPVLLTDAPSNLLAPIVPAFVDHGVITQKDAAAGVVVQIPDFTNALAGDRIVVRWGNTVIGGVDLLPGDLNPAPGTPIKAITLSYADVIAEGSGNGKQVIYEVWRGGLLAGTSPATTVDVNLTSPGPDPDPDPSTGWHENLVPLNVRSASGQNNVIPPADFNQDATTSIPHLGKDGRVIWQVGDRVQVSWDGVLIGTPIPITAANVGTDIPFTIPAAIVSASAGIKDVFYIVSRDVPPGQVATAEAQPTPVNVQSPASLPGNGSLTVVLLPEENPASNLINAAWPAGTVGGLDGTPIRVPLAGVTNVAVGDRINLRFVGRVGLTNPGTGDIPGTEVTIVDYSITQTDLTRGYYELNVAYNNGPLQRICRNGATVDYSITNNAGKADAAQKFVRIALNRPGDNGVCRIYP